MKKNNLKAWLYLLPAILFLGFFMLYPLVDVIIYSFEEKYNTITQTYVGVGFYNYYHVLCDTYFLSAVKNTFLIVIITVPISTLLALLIALSLNSIKPLRSLFQTIFFLPYITNTIAIGIVFLIIFDKTPQNIGLFNKFLSFFHVEAIDFINGSYQSKMFVLCLYIIWYVMPFKILVLIGALQNINQDLYKAARLDNASKFKTFRSITLPEIMPMIYYLIITGFIGAFKEYNDAVALFGTKLQEEGMNTIVGYVYNMLYDETGGYPSYASSAAVILFLIILTITVINLLISNKIKGDVKNEL